MIAKLQVDIEPFINGQRLSAEKLNQLVDRLNELGQERKPSIALPAIAATAAVAASSSKQFSRRSFLTFGRR